MKTIIVTGGAGFLGSNLCALLLKKGEKVICVDNLITGSRRNIEPLLSNQNFSFIEHDITKPLAVDDPIDQLYNLASPASPIDFKSLAYEIMMVNSVGVKNMLDLALEKKARFFQASTSEVYGDPLEHPQKETYWGNVNCNGPRSCYDEGKRFAEALIMAYQRKHNMEVRLARIFNTYGPNMRPNDGRVIPDFINQALKGEPITVFGTGEQTRSFCYVDDLVEGFHKLMNSSETGPINIGNPDEYTILETAEMVKAATDSNSEIVFKALPQDDPTKRRPDISMAKELLQWEPKVGFEEGLDLTIKYFKSLKGGY